jgi:hypothetical protein
LQLQEAFWGILHLWMPDKEGDPQPISALIENQVLNPPVSSKRPATEPE